MNAHDTITQKIVEAIQAGVKKGFQMPWHGASLMPVNAVSGRPYNGINTLSLWMEADQSGFSSNAWATFKQWKAVNCKVKKGERGTLIVFYKPLEKGEEDERTRFVLRHSHVFNASQVDGFEDQGGVDHCPDDLGWVDAMMDAGVDIRFGGDRAFYHPVRDHVQLPPRQAFTSSEGFASVLFHECAHWTGHTSRLDRQFGARGTEDYAFEELVAELAAAFLCADFGVSAQPRDDHAQYVQSWLSLLQNDTRAIFRASRLASQAAGFFAEKREKMAA